MKKLILLLFGVADVICLLSQPPSTFVGYTVDNGLAQNSIWQLFQDRRGFIWSATSDGLTRFDGQHFTTYRHQIGNQNSLSSTGFTKMVEDRYGYLWIGTGSGVDRYDPFTDKITRMYADGSENLHVPVDQSDSNEMWVWVNRKGFAVLDLLTGKLRKFIRADSIYPDLPGDNCMQVENDAKGNMWMIGEQTGLLCWRYSNNTCERILPALKLYGRHTVLRLEQDTLWVGAAESEHTITTIDTRNRKVLRSYALYSTNGEVLRATALLRSNSGWIIGSMNGGVVQFNSDFSSPNYSRYVSLSSAIQWYALLIDRNGILWAGSDGAGVRKENGAMKAFYTLRRSNVEPYLVKNIFTSDSLVYTCVYQQGIDVFSPDGTYVKSLQSGSNSKGKFRFVSANAKVDNANYWLMGDSCFGKFSVYDHTFTDYFDSVKQVIPDALVIPHFSALCITSDRTLFAGFSNQLIALNNNGGPTRIELIHRFERNNISALVELPTGELVVGTYRGLWLKNESNGKWIQHKSIGDLHVKSLCVDADGQLWVGTISGLFQINMQSDSAELFDENDGLPNSFIYGIVKDEQGALWFSHNKGLSKVDPHTYAFVHYTTTHGLQSNEFNTGAYHRSEDGRLYFGGINGTNGFKPAEILARPKTSRVLLSSILLFDEPVSGDTSAWARKTLHLSHQQNTLSFFFTSSDYASPELNMFSWKMEGIDEKWSGATQAPNCRYPNIPPGGYKLLVKATNCDGVWGETTHVLTIYIDPPWWTTWWFITITVASGTLLIAGFIYFLFSLQRKVHQREILTQQRIHSERERISRDLHDNVGAQLALILSQIEWMKKNDQHSGSAALPLDELGSTAKETIRKLRESIWAVQRETIPIDEFSDKFKAYALDQTRYLPEIRISFSESFENITTLTPEITLNIFAICQEALTNAIKHANPAEIKINFSSGMGNIFLFEMSDNGKGYDQNQKSHGNGLRNIRYRASQAGAEITITSAPDKGTQIRLRIPDNKS